MASLEGPGASAVALRGPLCGHLRVTDQSLPLPPDEGGADHEIPHRADQRAGEAGDPPAAVVIENPGGDADIGNRADGADHLEADEAGDEANAAQALIL